MGRLIPAGTGMEYYRNIEVENPFEEAEEPPELEGPGPKEADGEKVKQEVTR